MTATVTGYGTFWDHNTVAGFEGGIAALRQMFANGPDEMNWVLASTSGVHGTYTTIDDLERTWDDVDEDGDPYPHAITILVVQPRLCNLRGAHIDVERDDLPWLRDLVGRSLAAIARSQEGNLPPATATIPAGGETPDGVPAT